MACFLALLILMLGSGGASAHEFDAEQIEIYDAHADVLDGDTGTLFVQMTIENGAATTDLVGFETPHGEVSSWIEVRRVFGKDVVRSITRKTLRTKTAYELQQPHAYLIVEHIDPVVFTANYGYLPLRVLFNNGEQRDVIAWIDPIYVQVGFACEAVLGC